MASVNFASGFTLLCDDGRRFEFAPGEQEIPDELAGHWFVKAHMAQPAYNADNIIEPTAKLASEQEHPSEIDEPRKPGRSRKP